MIIVYEKIMSLADINFDYLFSRSYDHLDGNFPWPDSVIGFFEKQNFYRSYLELAINGTRPVNATNDTFIMFKTIVDDEDLEFTAGYIDENGCFSIGWYLAARGPMNSRNWIYSPEAKIARNALFLDNGILTQKILTDKNSSLYRMFKLRANAGVCTIFDEYPSVEGDNPKNLVTLIVQR